ncbi:hypothetical protein Q4543_11285 [Salipiger sp. 1_MG-2023]|uniref:hypothetical protein n=1 Tax=Salipiger sp. 1_MG-2023 TaxID=3062665 RepID=UPI0026E2C50E|nr:hypothetical protein [Salipiger sp. 1_MG-2023]MDO6586107.1 hypothetical protein [Salipiger sp. 1_MG-2023]
MTTTDLQPTVTAKAGLSLETGLYLFVAVFLAVVIAATVTFGAVGLAMCALACVPVCYAMILLITVGK